MTRPVRVSSWLKRKRNQLFAFNVRPVRNRLRAPSRRYVSSDCDARVSTLCLPDQELEQQESALLERATGTLGNVEAAKRDGDQLMLAQRRRESVGAAEGSLVHVARSHQVPRCTRTPV